MRKLMLGLLASTIALGALAACGDDDDSETTDTTEAASDTTTGSETTEAAAECSDSLNVGYSIPLGQDPSFVFMGPGLERALDAAGHTYASADAQGDPNKQVSDVETLVAQDIDVLFIAPLNEEAMLPRLEALDAEGTAVILQEVDKGNVTSRTNAYNYDAGAAMAHWIANNVGENAKGLALLGPSFVQVLGERGRGFTETAEEIGLEILEAKEMVNFTAFFQESAATANTWKTQYPDAEFIFGFNDLVAAGAGSALGPDWAPTVTGMNAVSEAVAALEAGQLGATVDNRLDRHVAAVVELVNLICAQAEVPQQVDLTLGVLDSTNVGEWTDWDTRLDTNFIEGGSPVEFVASDEDGVFVMAPTPEDEALYPEEMQIAPGSAAVGG